MGNKICVIGVYFGKLPNYFRLWLNSCKANPMVDFLLVTDNLVQEEGNICVRNMSLQELEDLATQKLGIDVKINKPYKCCDFRPAFGVIFEDYLKGYDYWGHCDFDVIFGDLSAFFEQYKLYDYDKFLVLGHLALYKNTREINSMYKLDGSYVDYKTVFTSSEGYAFDEFRGIGSIFAKHDKSIFKDRIFADLSSKYERFRLIEVYPFDEKPKNYKYQTFYWENGKVYRCYYSHRTIVNEEFIYVHFQKRPNFVTNEKLHNAMGFYITNDGFIEKDGQPTKTLIKTLNPSQGRFVELKQEIKEKLEHMKSKLCKILRFFKKRREE